MDGLSESLMSLRLKSTFFGKARLFAPWGVFQETFHDLMFHYVIQGPAFVASYQQSDSSWHRIDSGDFILFPRGDAHALADSPETPLIGARKIFTQQRDGIHDEVRVGGSGQESKIACGCFTLEGGIAEILTLSLPRFVHLKSGDPRRSKWFEDTIHLFTDEMKSRRPGYQNVISSLLNLLFVYLVRSLVENQTQRYRGLLLAFRDQQLLRVLTQVHSKSHESWNLDNLAALASLSRSAFSKRFSETIGISAMQYVNQVRIQESVTMLRNTTLSVKEVANKLGFQSSEVYIRNFKAQLGYTPTDFRTRIWNTQNESRSLQCYFSSPTDYKASP